MANPFPRWKALIRDVTAAVNQHCEDGWGEGGRAISPAIARRIIRTVDSGQLPHTPADLCILSTALEKLSDRSEDMENLYLAVDGLWNLKILVAAAGGGS